MEVADQWRREWAGTAEYGQVLEGGVTRQVARAMEVMNASGPGARVRVMRAAYHSSAGPGAPASSYMVHSSRRVISSGFNFMDPPSLPSKPLEISSMPLEHSQDSYTDTENYKVTEPDDTEISEPSKWKSSVGGTSIRMPSEESSSTDNASIIDLDSKINKNSTNRKYSYDSENSDIPINSGRNSRVSPLLDASVSLSTLRFKSLLNNNSDWNNRRKSYSFEDTSPISETIMHSNDTLAMESSTDSGICKSTELVNDNIDDNKYKFYKSREKDKPKDTFQNWLANNNQTHYNKKSKPYKYHYVDEDPAENNITLQSSGKVSITLPITVEADEGYVYRNNQTTDEGSRKVKKVEFCKTELHFAAETGRVNIISTDNKPPPSNDFRKRRSAFVPLRDMSEKPITLFGDKSSDFSNDDDFINYTINDIIENDENTAATKSILKNKIPKPKPYLLGENMEFGEKADYDNISDVTNVQSAVSLINKQLQGEKWSDNKITSSVTRQDTSSFKNSFRTINQGLHEYNTSGEDTCGIRNERYYSADEEPNTGPITRIHAIKRSPTPGRIKARELKESELTYFGVNNQHIEKPTPIKVKQERFRHRPEESTNVFQSVKLIQQVSNSVCNSESEDSPEYENVPFNKNYVPKPTPRIRSKFDDKPNQIDEIKVMKPIIERAIEVTNDDSSLSRRSKLRKHEDFKVLTNRSRSEPRKSYNNDSIERSPRRVDQSTRSTEKPQRSTKVVTKDKTVSDDDTPVYVNLKKYNVKNTPANHDQNSMTQKSSPLGSARIDSNSITRRKPKQVQCADISVSSGNTNNNEKKKNVTQTTEVIVKMNKDDNSSNFKTNAKYTEPVKQLNKPVELKPTRLNDSINKTDRKSRCLQRNQKTFEENEEIRKQARQQLKDKSTNEFPNDTKIRTKSSTKNNTSSRNEVYKVIPKVNGHVSNKDAASKDSSSRSASRSKRKEYVIKYDDKNGTVSSVTKIRSNSGSPKRKPVKDTTREKFRENSKNKASDKVALLQSEDHQRNWTDSEMRRKPKVRLQRNCEIL